MNKYEPAKYIVWEDYGYEGWHPYSYLTLEAALEHKPYSSTLLTSYIPHSSLEIKMQEITFEPFPKIARFSRNCVITEKLDGTNASIIITEDGRIGAASRNRLITPGKNTDNAGFAAWVQDNKEDLLNLGPGRHFGEWYGKGIQREYGLDHKRFALFNVSRWNMDNPPPNCCETVPIIWSGNFQDLNIEYEMSYLREHGCPG